MRTIPSEWTGGTILVPGGRIGNLSRRSACCSVASLHGEIVPYLSFTPRFGGYWVVFFIAASLFPRSALSCPFCAKFTRSYSDEVRDADAVAFGVLENMSNGDGGTTFRISTIVRANDSLADNSSIHLQQPVRGAEKQPIPRLVFLRREGNDWKAERIDKSSPAFAKYLKNAWTLFDEPAATRMAFFFKHLSDPDEKISADAYAEFAKASFRSTIAGSKAYDPASIRDWLLDPNTPGDRIGLLGLLLGLAGRPADADFLDRLVIQPSLTQRNGLDGLMGGLLLLDRPHGEKRIIERLTSDHATSLERLSAVSALRFLLSDLPVHDPEPLLQQVLPALQYSDLAGQLIDEMRKAKFWVALPDVLTLFPKSRDPSAILRFAIECPLPDAKAFVEEMRVRSPALVRDAEQTLVFERHARDAQQDLRVK